MVFGLKYLLLIRCVFKICIDGVMFLNCGQIRSSASRIFCQSDQTMANRTDYTMGIFTLAIKATYTLVLSECGLFLHSQQSFAKRNKHRMNCEARYYYGYNWARVSICLILQELWMERHFINRYGKNVDDSHRLRILNEKFTYQKWSLVCIGLDPDVEGVLSHLRGIGTKVIDTWWRFMAKLYEWILHLRFA